MISIIEEAAKSFFTQQLELSTTVAENSTKESPVDTLYVSSIKINLVGENSIVYIAYEEAFLKKMAHIMLYEDEPIRDTLIDLANESTNLIVGSAKVAAELKHDQEFTIEIPNFIGFAPINSESKEISVLLVDGSLVTITV